MLRWAVSRKLFHANGSGGPGWALGGHRGTRPLRVGTESPGTTLPNLPVFAMDCQTFLKKHDAFVDDTLPGVSMAVMRDHLDHCSRCARRDADIRRALLLIRNLPPPRVSDGFDDRLRDRIKREGTAPQTVSRSWSSWLLVRGAAVAALLLAVAVGGMGLRGEATLVPVLGPAVVTGGHVAPYARDDPAPAFVASMSTGIPMWPALMLAEEGPLLFATPELQAASYSREP